MNAQYTNVYEEEELWLHKHVPGRRFAQHLARVTIPISFSLPLLRPDIAGLRRLPVTNLNVTTFPALRVGTMLGLLRNDIENPPTVPYRTVRDDHVLSDDAN